MGLLSWLPSIIKGGKEITEEFHINKEANSKRAHEETLADMHQDAAVLNQFSQEFHQRVNRTKWDSFADGLNRLPRPLMTLSVLSFFVLAPIDPERFIKISQAYEAMPSGYWALLSIIISFYFGGRMQLQSHDMALKGSALQAAKELIKIRKDFRSVSDESDPPHEKKYQAAAIKTDPRENKVITEWKKMRSANT